MTTESAKVRNRRDEILDPAAAKDELRKEALRGGAVVCGVADAAAFTAAPEGHRPGDLLPRARTVVVLGGSAPRAGDWQSPLHEHQESMGTSERINSLGLKIAKLIEDKFGYYGLFIPPGVNKGNRPFLSVALAAELSGCGTASLAGPVLHPEYGLLYYSAIVTTLPFPVDGPLQEAVCPAPSCVEMWKERGTTPCLDVCPIQSGGCLGGEIVEGRFANRQYDAARCTSRVYTHWIPGFQKALEAAISETDQEKRKMILYSSFFTRTLWSITYSAQSQAQCFECMRVCPVGAEKRDLK
jgi:epoxyqueuosine reductase QueG